MSGLGRMAWQRDGAANQRGEAARESRVINRERESTPYVGVCCLLSCFDKQQWLSILVPCAAQSRGGC